MPRRTLRGVSWGGALGAWAPRGHQRGAKKQEKRKGKGKKERGEKRGKGTGGNKREKREERGSKKEKRKKESYINMTRGAPCSFKCKQGLQGRKRQGRQSDGEKDERGTMQFQVPAGAPGKKTSGAPK